MADNPSFKRSIKPELGATLTECALAIALVAVVALPATHMMGLSTKGALACYLNESDPGGYSGDYFGEGPTCANGSGNGGIPGGGGEGSDGGGSDGEGLGRRGEGDGQALW